MILQPQEKLDPYRHKKPEQDKLIQELVRLTDVRDRGLLAQRVRRLAEQAAESPRFAETRLRVLIESLALAARVGATLTTDLLAQIGPALDAAATATDPQVVENRAILLERALFFAAHYDRPELVRTFADRLGDLLRRDRPHRPRCTRALVGETLRSLRKFGLKDQTERLLQQINDAVLADQTVEQAQAIAGRDWQPTLRLLLHLAAGWLYFDRPEQAEPILNAARAWIVNPDRKPNDPARSAGISFLWSALTLLPPARRRWRKHWRIEELLVPGRMDRLPNTFTSNYYYSLFHLNVVEAVVLTLATDDLPSVRLPAVG